MAKTAEQYTEIFTEALRASMGSAKAVATGYARAIVNVVGLEVQDVFPNYEPPRQTEGTPKAKVTTAPTVKKVNPLNTEEGHRLNDLLTKVGTEGEIEVLDPEERVEYLELAIRDTEAAYVREQEVVETTGKTLLSRRSELAKAKRARTNARRKAKAVANKTA